MSTSESIAAALAAAAAETRRVRQAVSRAPLRPTGCASWRVPREASSVCPAPRRDPAVVADGVSGAELIGFRIVGDAATPLGTGIFAKNAEVSVVDVEITGASNVAIDLREDARLTLLASHIHDNPGAAMMIRAGASPRVNQNVFSRNGLSERAGAAIVVESDTEPTFFGNVFQGITANAFRPPPRGAGANDPQLVGRQRRRADSLVERPGRAARPLMDTVFNSVGPYEIVGEIGRGGMATVFLATDTRSGRRVALKLVPAGTDREAREILDAEQWGAKLQERFCASSRYVPEVYEHGTGGVKLPSRWVLEENL